MVKGALPVALVQLGYKSLTEDKEEAIFDFIKGHNSLLLFQRGWANRCAYASIPFIFDNTQQFRNALCHSVHCLS